MSKELPASAEKEPRTRLDLEAIAITDLTADDVASTQLVLMDELGGPSEWKEAAISS